MAISHELILEPADLDIISIQCKTCNTRFLLSLKKRAEIPAKCAWCGDDWQAIRDKVPEFRDMLKWLEEFKVTFHIPKPAAVKG